MQEPLEAVQLVFIDVPLNKHLVFVCVCAYFLDGTLFGGGLQANKRTTIHLEEPLFEGRPR